MLQALALKFWKEIAIAILVIGLGYMVYNHIYEAGAQQATEQYREEFKEYQKTITDKITTIENNSNELVGRRIAKDGVTKKEIEALLKTYTKVPLVDPVACALTPGFANSYNEIIERANK